MKSVSQVFIELSNVINDDDKLASVLNILAKQELIPVPCELDLDSCEYCYYYSVDVITKLKQPTSAGTQEPEINVNPQTLGGDGIAMIYGLES